MKSLHSDSDDNGLLFTFLDQADAPQMCRYLDDEGVPCAGENEDGNKVTVERVTLGTMDNEDSDSSNGSLQKERHIISYFAN